MITWAEVTELMGRWWVNYDEGNYDVLRSLVATDARFTCRSATGASAYEEFITADVTGSDAFMAWQIDHRDNSPYPLRHNATNLHLVERGEASASFSTYIAVTHMVNGMPALLPAGMVNGRVVREGDELRIAEMHVVLDTEDSVPFNQRTQ